MGLTPVAKHSGKGHCENQDGVGDDEYQHKNETDDAEQFGLLRFVFVLPVEGLWEGGEEGGVYRSGPGLVEHGELGFVQEREQRKECEDSSVSKGRHWPCTQSLFPLYPVMCACVHYSPLCPRL